MSSDPYAAPVSCFMERSEKERILRVARNQKTIQWLVLASLLLAPVAPPILLFTCLLALVYYSKLACDMYGAPAACLLTILAIVPLAGLFAFLIIDRNATNILNAHGFRVGFMGANLSKVKSWASHPRYRIRPRIFGTTDSHAYS